MQGFCPPRELQGNSAEGRARVFRDQSNAMLALSPKREYRSVTPTFRSFPQQRQKKGNICPLVCFPVRPRKRAHRAFVWLTGGAAPRLVSVGREKNKATMQKCLCFLQQFSFFIRGHLCNVAIFIGDRPHPFGTDLAGNNTGNIFLGFVHGTAGYLFSCRRLNNFLAGYL